MTKKKIFWYIVHSKNCYTYTLPWQVDFGYHHMNIRHIRHTLWNNMHKDMTQYRLRKCLKRRLRKHYIAKYHVWCIDWCLFLSVFDTYLPLLVLKIALFYSELSCHFVSYRPGYHVHFYLVVSKMSLVLPWQPPADNNVCFCLVKEYYLYICWKIKLLLLLQGQTPKGQGHHLRLLLHFR